MNATVVTLVDLASRELEVKRNEIKGLARKWLEPEHMAELLLDRSLDRSRDLTCAIGALLHTAYDARLFEVEPEKIYDFDFKPGTETDARAAFIALVEFYGAKRICELAKQFDTDISSVA